MQAIIVALLAFVFYINTWSNEFAHDDGIVLVKNEFVQEGFAGLHSIFTEDAYASYYRQLNTVNQLSGGRYRPLSIATFAIEQQFFGAVPIEKIDSVLAQNISYGVRGPAEKKLVHDMHIRHVINVLWYMGLAVVLLYFLRYIVFRNNPLMALIATAIFTIHPIHTEVVANVKSRDEIMSLLFICLTFIFAFKYEENKKQLGYLGGALACFFLAFLSKEYAITLAALIPLSLFLFKDYSIKKSIIATIPYYAIIAIYIYIRIKMAMHVAGADDASGQSLSDILDHMKSSGNAEKEVLNNPYYFATPPQKVATEIATSLNYLKLLLWPHPLSADYSYNTIPYKSFGNWQVLLSILMHSLIIAGMFFFTFVKKQYKIIAFAFAFYILHLLLVNNLIFNIGATMGERLIFHSSVGFAIVVSYLLVKGMDYIKPIATAQVALAALMGVIIVLSGFKTITRNMDWKNDKTLFFQDIKTVPNSVLVNGNVAAALITMSDLETKDTLKRKQYLRQSITLLTRAIDVHPKFVAGFLNRGIAYYKLGMIDSAKICLDSVKANYPNYPTLKTLYSLLGDYHLKEGWNKYGRFNKYPEAIVELKLGVAVDSSNAELWYNLGGAYFSNKQYKEAVDAWNMTLKINPKHEQANNGRNAALQALGAGPVSNAPKK